MGISSYHPINPGPFTPGDMFGGIAAKQDIVIALEKGKQELFETALDQVLRRMLHLDS